MRNFVRPYIGSVCHSLSQISFTGKFVETLPDQVKSAIQTELGDAPRDQ